MYNSYNLWSHLYMLFTCSYEVEPEVVVFCCPDVGFGKSLGVIGYPTARWWLKPAAVSYMVSQTQLQLRNHWPCHNPYAPCMVYLPTTLGNFWGKCRCAYTSTMEHLGNIHIHTYPYWSHYASCVTGGSCATCQALPFASPFAGLKERRPDVYSQMFGCHVWLYGLRRRVQGEQLS